MSAVMPTIDVMPMTMPSTVSADRSLLPRTVSHDIPRISENRLQRMLFAPQRFNRVQGRGPHGRIDTESEPDEGRHADPQHDRPRLDDRRQWADLADAPRHEEAERRTHEAAERRQGNRLG